MIASRRMCVGPGPDWTSLELIEIREADGTVRTMTAIPATAEAVASAAWGPAVVYP